MDSCLYFLYFLIKSANYFRYRENSKSLINTHVRLAVSVVQSGEVSPIHYLIDAGNNEWQKASVRIMGLC